MIVCDICKSPKSDPFKVEIQTLKVSSYQGKKANGSVVDYEKMDVCQNCLSFLTNKLTVLVHELVEHGQDVHVGYSGGDEYNPEVGNYNKESIDYVVPDSEA